MNDLIVRKESKRHPGLFVQKYHNSVFYKNLWTEELEEMRGQVVDADGKVIVQPLRKIYNYGIEDRAPYFSDWEIVCAQRKINGFMIAVTLYNGNLLFSTTGSLDSDFVTMAESMFTEDMRHYVTMALIHSKLPCTMVFEVVHPDDPHIIPEEVGVYPLAKRYHNQSLQRPMNWHDGWLLNGFKPVEFFIGKFEDVKRMAREAKHEGYVIYDLENTKSTKIKSPYYLFKKFVARINVDKIHRINKQNVDEEFYPVVDWLKEHQGFYTLDEQKRLEVLRMVIEMSTIKANPESEAALQEMVRINEELKLYD